ncbi:polysaccharide biosynthesis protein [Hathewaya histolytica]|uniref:Stage V sporulation protein B n=1 Tax=Hathewaya histolytica TaxID=1498 RepID=A0A4U9RUB4_HATHI|nr:polysaccharide biosynthesis protein [Hathewaya histolytica]VTQ95408.1 stage V sporulation protein B [Hathewaya histolytica]
MKRQTLIKSTLILGAAGIFARFLGLFFRIPMQILLGDEGMGYYQMSYPLYLTFIAVSSGIPIAVSKIISEMNAKNDGNGILRVIRSTFLIMIPTALAFSFILIFFSDNIITSLRWDRKSYYALIATSLAPVFVITMGILRGFFQGLHNMNPTAISQVIEQIGRVVGGVGLAYMLFPLGIEYAAGGAALGALIGSLLGFIYLVIKFLSVLRYIPKKKSDIKRPIVGDILRNAIPFSFGAVVGTIMGLVDSIVVPRGLLRAGFSSKDAAILYGQLTGKAATLSHVPLALSVALCTSIVPIVAEAYVKNRKVELQNKVEGVIKLSSVISMPSAMGLYFLSYPVMSLVFRGDFGGYTILKYMAISLPFIVLSQCSTTLLQAMNNFYAPVKNLAIGCILKIILTYILVPIPNINIYGAVIGSTIGYITSSILNMILIKRKLLMPINMLDSIIKPIIASLIMSISVILGYKYMYTHTLSNDLACLSAIVIGVITYLLAVIILKIFSYKEVKGKFNVS